MEPKELLQILSLNHGKFFLCIYRSLYWDADNSVKFNLKTGDALYNWVHGLDKK